MYIRRLFIILFLFTLNISAQIAFPDRVKTNKQKLIYLNQKALKSQNNDSTLSYYNQAIRFSKQNTCDSVSLSSYYGKSLTTYHLGKYDTFLLSIKTLERLNSNCNSLYFSYKTHLLYVDYYGIISEPDKAIEHNKKAIEIAKNLGTLELADAYYSLGYTYFLSNLNKQAKTYFLLALQYYDKANVDEKVKYRTYSGLINVCEDKEEIDRYLNKTLRLIEAYKNPYYIAYFYMQKGDAYFKINAPYNETKAVLLKAISYSEHIDDNNQIKSVNLYNLARLENKEKNYTRSTKIFEDLLKDTVYATVTNKINIYPILIDNYRSIGNYKKSFNLAEDLFVLKDSLQNIYSVEKFAEFDTKFKTAEKDKEIAQQKLQLAQEKSNRNKLIFSSLAVLLFGFIGFQWNNNRQKQKKLLALSQLHKEQEVNELRTKFLGNIAHEIRTPLTLISGNLELAKEHIEDKNKILKNIDVALINSKKVVEDANEILELLKFEKSKTTIKLTTIPLNENLKRIFKSFLSLAEMKKIKLQYNSNIPEDLTAETDIEKVEKILNNLISNAIKYSPSNSQIIFDADLDANKQLTIKVTDFGQGIHFNETEKIFERFYQSSQSNTVGGIGIGLSLAKEFAELLNGSLTVESELGKGSTFIFSFPIYNTVIQDVIINKETFQKEISRVTKSDRIRSNSSKNKQQEKIRPVERNNTKPKILIVEDNPEMASYLEEILSKNYQCEKAFDGLEALEKIKTGNFELITSDIMMPRLDGFQLREKLNENKELKNIPFILISAKTLEEDKIKGFNLGIDDYIVKPFNKNELIARVENLLVNKYTRQNWIKKHPEAVEHLESSQEKLLDQIKVEVEKNISNEEFKVAELATAVGYSQRQLTRILKQFTGMSPVKFILEIRLQKAYSLLQNKVYFTLSEVRYDVGITSSSYFNKKFKERFGINPKDKLM